MAKPREAPPGESDQGLFAYDGLHRSLHEKARLGILTALCTHAEGRVFSELKTLCSLTDGNLNRHLKVLQDESLIQIKKEQTGRRGQTRVLLTSAGRRGFLAYLDELERVVNDARAAASRKDLGGGSRKGALPA